MNIKLHYITSIFVIVILLLILNHWCAIIPNMPLDSTFFILFFCIIGLSLLPHSNKIKIANFIEFDKVNSRIDEIEDNLFLGSIVKTESSEYYYIDIDGKHLIPDIETKDFLSVTYGVKSVKTGQLKRIKNSYIIDSVLHSKIVKSEPSNHIFLILNNKKYYVNSYSFLIDWKRDIDIDKFESKTIEELKLYPTGR